MKSWKKENKLKMRVTYSMDKYKESEEYGDTLEVIEGEMVYINMPMANSFLNVKTDAGAIMSIAYPLVMQVEWLHMPKWTVLTEAQVVDSANMRLLNLDNELEIQKNNFEQDKRLKETRDKSMGVD